MLQPRQSRKWSRSEKWILGASLPVLLAFGWWSFGQPDQKINVGQFKMNMASARFTVLAKPTILLADRVALAQRHTNFKRLVPVQMVVNLNHYGPRPSWWGHQDDVWTVMWFTSKTGMMFDTMAGRTATRFDHKTQCYIIHYECMMPEQYASSELDTCTFKGGIQFSPRYTNMKDPSAPTTLNHSFQFSTDIRASVNELTT